jgi:signal transduction histidine kinase
MKRQARRLQRFFVVLVAVVALVPAGVFVVLEIGHYRSHGSQSAARLVAIVAAQLDADRRDIPGLAATLRREMDKNDLVALRLVAAAGGADLELGEPGQRLLPTEVRWPLPAGTAPWVELRVEADDRSLLSRVARVFGIHVLVAAGLALLAYYLPMRALRLAITEGERTYAQLVHADKLSAIGEIYAGLTHEINNPLGMILARVRLLLGAVRAGAPVDPVGDLEMIDRHGTRIADIVRGLLAFARKTTFELTDADLNALIGDVVGLLEKPFAKQRVRIETRLDPTVPRLRASPDQLQQVFVNLFNNARDAMPEGGTITVRTTAHPGEVVAEVEDTGTGIAPEILERVFEPFFSTKPVGKGTGMGLAVSYGIVKAHGGEITVESRRGHGARFRLRLPADGQRR